MGEGGDFVRETAKKAVANAMKLYMQSTSFGVKLFDIGCLVNNQKQIQTPDGSLYNAHITGKITSLCGPVIRLNNTDYLMIGEPFKFSPNLDGGKRGRLLVGGWNTPTFEPSFALGISQTGFPHFAIVDTRASSSFWTFPQDTSLDIYQVIATDSPAGGHDGFFYAQFGPTGSDVAMVRVVQSHEGYSIFAGVGPQPSVTVAWNWFQGLQFHDQTNSVSYKTVTGGTFTINYPGRTVGDPQSLESFNVLPVMHWDNNGTWDFDLFGMWIVDGDIFGHHSEGLVFGKNMKGGGGVNSVEGYTAGTPPWLFGLNIFAGRNRFVMWTPQHMWAWNNAVNSLGPGLGANIQFALTNAAADIVTRPNFQGWCTPYLTPVTQFPNTPTEGFDDCIFMDLTRAYFKDLSPLLGNIVTGNPINGQPTDPNKRAQIKTLNNQNFLLLEEQLGTKPSWNIQTLKWNPTGPGTMSGGTKILGQPITYPFGGSLNMTAVLDWALV